VLESDPAPLFFVEAIDLHCSVEHGSCVASLDGRDGASETTKASRLISDGGSLRLHG